VAIAAQWSVAGTSVTTTTAIFTVATSSASTYAYSRDLVITNGGPSLAFFSLGSGSTSAATTSSFAVPSGGSVVLTQCQVPSSGKVYAVSAGTSSCYVGYATNVSYA
jgi:hypothetical protein